MHWIHSTVRDLLDLADLWLVILASAFAFTTGLTIYALLLPIYAVRCARTATPFSWAKAFGFPRSSPRH